MEISNSRFLKKVKRAARKKESERKKIRGNNPSKQKAKAKRGNGREITPTGGWLKRDHKEKEGRRMLNFRSGE